MAKELSRDDLLKKIGRAELKLEQSKANHSPRCIIELDPDSTAPCSCGAAKINAAIDAALRELKTD